MSSSDDTSFNQSANEEVPLEAPAAEKHTLSETSEQNIANSKKVNSSIFDMDLSKRPANDLSMGVLKFAQQSEAMLKQIMTPSVMSAISISALAQGAYALQNTGLSALTLANLPVVNALKPIIPILPQLNFANQIAKFSTIQITPFKNAVSPISLLLGNFADPGISMVNNWTVPFLASSIAAPFYQDAFALKTLSASLAPPRSLELLSSFWLPSIELWKQLQFMNDFFLGLNGIINLTNSINAFVGAMPDFLRRLKENLKRRILAAFKRIVFCLAPSMPEDLMYWVLDQVEAGNSNIAVARICNDYTRNGCVKLQQTIERWQDNPEFARRWPFIWQAFQSYSRKEYISSMRVLAPEIEGMSKHVLMQNRPLQSLEGRQGWNNFSSPKDTIIGALNEVIDRTYLDSSNADIVAWVRFQSVVGFTQDEFAKKIDFRGGHGTEYYNFRRGVYSRNRHGNLHGMQLNGFSAANSLRLFLMLDAMYDLFQGYMLRGGNM